MDPYIVNNCLPDLFDGVEDLDLLRDEQDVPEQEEAVAGAVEP